MVEKMTIDRALYVLAKEHTKDDDRTGFSIHGRYQYPISEFPDADYIEAWRVVREKLKMQTNPGKR